MEGVGSVHLPARSMDLVFNTQCYETLRSVQTLRTTCYNLKSHTDLLKYKGFLLSLLFYLFTY